MRDFASIFSFDDTFADKTKAAALAAAAAAAAASRRRSGSTSVRGQQQQQRQAMISVDDLPVNGRAVSLANRKNSNSSNNGYAFGRSVSVTEEQV